MGEWIDGYIKYTCTCSWKGRWNRWMNEWLIEGWIDGWMNKYP